MKCKHATETCDKMAHNRFEMEPCPSMQKSMMQFNDAMMVISCRPGWSAKLAEDTQIWKLNLYWDWDKIQPAEECPQKVNSQWIAESVWVRLEYLQYLYGGGNSLLTCLCLHWTPPQELPETHLWIFCFTSLEKQIESQKSANLWTRILAKNIRDGIPWRKNILNGHCPLSSDPRPPPPKRARWSFFRPPKRHYSAYCRIKFKLILIMQMMISVME